ncbi:MAG: preprotein translocase subunit YajC [Rikenellaceae bacterium]|nr:preprotein translocase subunit YajC [Rikenellaceae bacterium]
MERYNLLIMMILVFGVMYLFMIRPQQKKQKEMVKFRSALEKGDKVITAGGIYGTIKEVKDTYVLLEVDNGVSIRVEKSMISQAPDPSAQPKK